jgi:hypothetical protein
MDARWTSGSGDVSIRRHPQTQGRGVRRMTIPEFVGVLPELEALLSQEGELQLVRDGQVIARVLPAPPKGRMPSHAAFRAQFPRLKVGSEVLVREDRDSR